MSTPSHLGVTPSSAGLSSAALGLAPLTDPIPVHDGKAIAETTLDGRPSLVSRANAELVSGDVGSLPFSHRLATYGSSTDQPEILVVGDSIVRYVELPGAVTYCLSGGKVLELIELIPVLIVRHPSVHTVIVHVGTNDVMFRQSIKLQYDLESLAYLIESLGKNCRLSGPIPTLRKGSERFSRLYSLNVWMNNFCTATGFGFINNFDSFWTEITLFHKDGLHLNKQGTKLFVLNLVMHIAFVL